MELLFGSLLIPICVCSAFSFKVLKDYDLGILLAYRQQAILSLYRVIKAGN